jgi:hypothetical protein
MTVSLKIMETGILYDQDTCQHVGTLFNPECHNSDSMHDESRSMTRFRVRHSTIILRPENFMLNKPMGLHTYSTYICDREAYIDLYTGDLPLDLSDQ